MNKRKIKYITQITALLFFLFVTTFTTALGAELTRIDIIAVNDFHGALLEDGKTPGGAKWGGFIKALRNENPQGTLLVSAGDMFQGTVRSNILYGKPVIQIMNNLNFTAMAVGNHEFDWGIDNILRARSQEAKFPFISANVLSKATGKPIDFVLPYIIAQIKGIKVGIIGLTTQETAYTSNMKIVSQYNFTDPAETIMRVLPAVRAAGAQVVVVVAHIGCEADENGIHGEFKDVLQALQEKNAGKLPIDAVISGHTHTFVQADYAGIPVVQALYSGLAVGRVSLYYSEEEKKVVESKVEALTVDPAKAPSDRKIEKIIARSAKSARPIELSVIGYTETGVEHDRHTTSLLGQLVTDTMRQAANADVAFMNGGGLRKPLAPGKITLGTLYDIMPFDNTLVTVEISGKQIAETLEYGLSGELGTVQYSGVRLVYDPSKEAGNRIVQITLADGTPLQMDKTYLVCTNDFMADGGDGFVLFKQGKNLTNTNIVLRDVFAETVKATKNLVVKNDGRFAFAG